MSYSLALHWRASRLNPKVAGAVALVYIAMAALLAIIFYVVFDYREPSETLGTLLRPFALLIIGTLIALCSFISASFAYRYFSTKHH